MTLTNQQRGFYLDNKEEILRKLNALVIIWREEAQEYDREGEKGIARMKRGDAMQAKKCATAVRNHKWERAEQLARWCDTAVRECMPDEFWEFYS